MRVSLVPVVLSLLISAKCLATSEDLTNSRIVNGYEVNITEIPYQATLRLQVTLGWAHLCGAAIIGTNTLLTAAHCVTIYQTETTRLRVTVGTSYRLSSGKSYNLKRIVVHENYSDSTLENDIALLVTSSKMSYSNSVKAIAIAPKTYNIANGAEAIVSGFGTITYKGSASPVLLAAKVNVIAQATCIRAYLGIASVTDGMICAGADNPPRDACQGDSGGPLVSNNVLIGIVSWGEKCADQSYPGVYTRVSEYEPWVVSRVNQYA